MEDHFEPDLNNPLLQPIHGVSLQDYAAAMYYSTAGIPVEQILRAFNITPTVWNEVHLLWSKRMEQDAGMTVITHFSRFYNEAKKDKRISIP